MNINRFLSTFTVTGMLLLSLGMPVMAAPDLLSGSPSSQDEQAEPGQPTDAVAIEQRLAAVVEEKKNLTAQIEAGPESRTALESKHLVRSQEKLEQIDRLLNAQLSLAQNLATTTSSAGDQLPDDVPSVFTLNVLYEKKSTADAVLREKRSTLASAKEQLKSLASRAREASTALGESNAANRARNERTALSATLAVRVQEEQVNLATLELRAAKAEAGQGNSLKVRIDAVREALASNADESNDAVVALMERESALQRARSRAERQLATAELRLTAEKQRYAASPQSSGDVLAVVEALTAYRDTLGKQISLATAELDRLGSLGEIWANWDALLRTHYIREDFPLWQELADTQLSDLKLTETLRQGQLADLEIRLESVETRTSQLPATSKARSVLQETAQELDKFHSNLLASARQAAADQRMTQRFSDEIATVTGNLSFREYVSLALEKTRGLWNFEITTIDEAPFTVGSLTLGLLLFAVGLWASRLGAGLVGRIATHRLKLDTGAVHAMQTFSFYAFLIGFTLLALNTVHFPLTAFTFLGGALAIGVGFGSQNVMNNFISGLILMLERPVRAQDVVEVDGSHGVIQKIGPRSTHIRSTDGRHIVVPNSFFLESNVVNWTLSDDLMRTKVSVGVSYGSPTRLVKQLLEDVAKNEPLVLNQPSPQIIFDAFADNSLNFDVYVWVEARSPMSVRDVQSRIRFAIDDVFRENNLVIAYPQRDVHLDAVAPIDIRLIRDADA